MPLIRWAPEVTAVDDPAANQAALIHKAVGPSHIKRNPETQNPQREP